MAMAEVTSRGAPRQLPQAPSCMQGAAYANLQPA